MKNGIYYVDFGTPGHPGTGGLVVVDEGRIHGGDPQYLYIGKAQGSGQTVQATIKVKHYRAQVSSVFGNLKEFDLTLTGSSTDTSFTLKGNIVGRPQPIITITGKKHADLVQ